MSETMYRIEVQRKDQWVGVKVLYDSDKADAERDRLAKKNPNRKYRVFKDEDPGTIPGLAECGL